MIYKNLYCVIKRGPERRKILFLLSENIETETIKATILKSDLPFEVYGDFRRIDIRHEGMTHAVSVNFDEEIPKSIFDRPTIYLISKYLVVSAMDITWPKIYAVFPNTEIEVFESLEEAELFFEGI